MFSHFNDNLSVARATVMLAISVLGRRQGWDSTFDSSSTVDPSWELSAPGDLVGRSSLAHACQGLPWNLPYRYDTETFHSYEQVRTWRCRSDVDFTVG